MEIENAASTALTRKYQLRYLWQVPVLLAGLCAVAGAWAARPLWYDPEVRTFTRAFNGLRDELANPSPDYARARDLGEDALVFVDRFRRHGADLHYMLGSSYLFLASAADSSEAPELWRRARSHLEEADARGVAPGEVGRLRYRLGKAWFYTGQDPQRVVDCLVANADLADDRVEGFGMIAQAYLRLPSPDLRAALDANQKQLSQPVEDDRVLAPARLLRGELLLRVKEPAQAREALARIPNSASPDILARVRHLRASIAQEEGLWAEAVQSWEQVLGEGAVPPEDVARVRYYMGICYQRLNRPGEAARAWDLALAGGGAEEQAAALALAALRHAAGDPSTAMKMYERFLTAAPNANAYRNDLVPLSDARGQINRACTRFREKKDFARSEQLAQWYAKLARPGEADDLRARAADSWADELSSGDALEKAAAQYREAAAAYLALAGTATEPADKCRAYRRAAERYFRAKDYPAALAALEPYRRIETAPEALAESWLLAARVYSELNNKENAAEAYRKCIEFPGPTAFHARLALAQADADSGRLDNAEDTLKQNLELDLSYESETRKLTLFTLADLQYRRGKYTLASLRYQEALDHYPTAPQAPWARFHLGDCYRLLADLENQNLGFGRTQTPEALRLIRERYRRWLMMALANFQKCADDLSTRRASTALTSDEELLLRQAEFAQGKCQIDLGHYVEAIKLFEILAVRYRYQVAHLNALREVWRCQWMMRSPDRARETVRLMRTVLREVDPIKIKEETNQSPEEWLQWVEWAEKQ